MSYDRRFLPATDSQDTLGQAVWGLGTVVASAAEPGWRALAAEGLLRALPAVTGLTATRSVAYAMTGLRLYLERFPGALAARRALVELGERQVERLVAHSRDGWSWFDDSITYGNAMPPEALLRAGLLLDEPRWVEAGRTSLDWLLERTFVDGRFEPVGNDGWWHRDGERARYGQQPIEAGLTARACVAAHEVTGERVYLDRARDAVRWLLGENRLGAVLYDAESGRCADGLDRHGASDHAGAESTVCALLGLLALPHRQPLPALQLDALVAPRAEPEL